MGIILRPDKSLLSREHPGLQQTHTHWQTHWHTQEARYQSEMALKRLNERLPAEMTMFSGRLLLYVWLRGRAWEIKSVLWSEHRDMSSPNRLHLSLHSLHLKSHLDLHSSLYPASAARISVCVLKRKKGRRRGACVFVCSLNHWTQVVGSLRLRVCGLQIMIIISGCIFFLYSLSFLPFTVLLSVPSLNSS